MCSNIIRSRHGDVRRKTLFARPSAHAIDVKIFIISVRPFFVFFRNRSFRSFWNDNNNYCFPFNPKAKCYFSATRLPTQRPTPTRTFNVFLRLVAAFSLSLVYYSVFPPFVLPFYHYPRSPPVHSAGSRNFAPALRHTSSVRF